MCDYFNKIYPNVYLGDNAVHIHGKLRSHLIDTGIRLGRGLVSKDRSEFWVNIPKNASSSMSQFLLERKWKDANYINSDNIFKNAHKHVILRDPVDRWKKCVVELCNTHLEQAGPHPGRFDYWFRKQPFTDLGVYYDLHFIRQVDHIIALDWSKVSFYYCDYTLTQQLGARFHGLFTVENQTATNKKKMKALPYVEELMTPEFVGRLKEFYALDYQLINRVIQPSIELPPIIINNDIMATAIQTTNRPEADTI